MFTHFPFMSMEDFKKVHGLLISQDTKRIQTGVLLLKHLCRGKTEICQELEMSHILFGLKAKYLDLSQCGNSRMQFIFDHRLALSQFQNYLINAYEIEMEADLNELAEKFEIPSYLMSTIENVMSNPADIFIQPYREALDFAINFLDVHFWKAVPKEFTKLSPNDASAEAAPLRTLIAEYKRVQYENLYDGTSIESNQEELNNILKDIFSWYTQCGLIFYEVMNENDVFLSEGDIEKLVTGEYVRELHCTCSDGDSTLLGNHDCVFLTVDSEVTHLPQIIIELWMPFLKELLRHNCFETFIYSLAKELKKNRPQKCQKLGLAWIYNVLLLGCQKATNTKLDAIAESNAIESVLDPSKLLFLAVESSTTNIFSIELLKNLGEDFVVLASRIAEIVEQNQQLINEQKDPIELLKDMKNNAFQRRQI